jgi:hypothetical protein
MADELESGMCEGAEPASLLVIACGALAHEIVALKEINRWAHIDVQCLPAKLHNRPVEIPGAVREKIRELRHAYRHIYVAYADCGTGGKLDAVLASEGIERLPGAHCYEFFARGPDFAALQEEELCTFYLTDFLAWHFERLVIEGLGIDRFPELQSIYFGNYKRLVYLAQTDPPRRLAEARAAAARLGLAFVHRHTGYGDLANGLGRAARAAAPAVA